MKSAREAEIGDTLYAQNKPVKPLIDIEPAKVDTIQNLAKCVHCTGQYIKLFCSPGSLSEC